MTREGSGARILIVEDERHIAAGLKLNLELEDYQVAVAASGREMAAQLVSGGPFDLLLLDVALPDVDGFTLCNRLRESGDFTPVLMLTARDGVDDRVRGLEAGADDYLAKPFSYDELLARLRSLLRRRGWEQKQGGETSAVTAFGDVRIDKAAATVHRGTVEIKLTKLEFDLLVYFLEHPLEVLTRARLQQDVWKLNDYPNSRMVDNFVMRLRRHFEPDAAAPKHFLSVRGWGYKFSPGP